MRKLKTAGATYLTPALFSALKQYNLGLFTKDLFSGIVVGVIALPLSLALAIASGAQPVTGLVTVVAGGGIACLLSGSRYQVSGPTAAFIPIVLSISAAYGAAAFTASIFLAGIILALMGVFKLGRLINYIALPIVAGFTAGIAASLFFGQLGDFFGYDYSKVPSKLIAKIGFYIGDAPSINPVSAAVGIACVAAMFVLNKFFKKLPSSLIVLMLAVGAEIVFALPVETVGGRFGALQFKMDFALPDFSYGFKLFIPAVTIAVLAAIESLLSARAAEGIAGGGEINPDAELLSQGAGNLMSALFGGLPVTGAIARTSANIKNGGKTPVSAFIHALTILLIGLLLMPYAVYIPITALSAVLIVVCFNMVNVKEIKKIMKSCPRDIALFFTALILTVVFDLVVSIAAGVSLSLIWAGIKALGKNKNQLDLKSESIFSDGLQTVKISGTFNFLTAGKFKFSYGENMKAVLFDLSAVLDADAAAFEKIEKEISVLKSRGIPVNVLGCPAYNRYANLILQVKNEQSESIQQN